jgi:hypothetical protein
MEGYKFSLDYGSLLVARGASGNMLCLLKALIVIGRKK